MPPDVPIQAPEREVCSVLRIKIDQYLHAKHVILHKTRQLGYIAKKDAKRLIHMDVNKTGRIYDW